MLIKSFPLYIIITLLLLLVCIVTIIPEFDMFFCLQVRKSIADAGSNSGNVPREAWCAAHLNMLCSSAVRAYESYGRYNDTGTQRGFLVNYDSLPGSIARLLLPSFGIEPSEYWLTRMAVESKQYSKSRGAVPLPFTGDSEDKEERATAGIQKFAKLILDPTYDVMEKISADGLKELSPSLYTRMLVRRENGMEISWQMLKDVPITPSHDVPLAMPRVPSSSAGNILGMAGLGLASASVDSVDGKDNLIGRAEAGSSDSSSSLRGNKHSSFTKEKEKIFVPWAPFSNTHSSRPYEVWSLPVALLSRMFLLFFHTLHPSLCVGCGLSADTDCELSHHVQHVQSDLRELEHGQHGDPANAL